MFLTLNHICPNTMVRLDCPLISFFFARLGGLLGIGRQCPKVGLFVGRDCPFRFDLCFLFPLGHCSMGIGQSLIIFGEGEVRSSELETGLSLFEDHRALEVTSSTTPYKA